MAKTLRDTTDLFANVLATWREWPDFAPKSKPSVLRILPEGSRHCAALLDTPTPLVLRVAHRQNSRERQADFEHHSWRLAANCRLAPDFVILNTALPATLSYYFPKPKLPDGREMGLFLKRLHTLEADPAPLSLGDTLERYQQLARDHHQIDVTECLPNSPAVLSALAQIEDTRPLLCHNDLTAGNWLTDGQGLLAIDWEYAATGCSYFDVASALSILDVPNQQALLEAYSGKPQPSDRQITANALYAVTCWWWSLARGDRQVQTEGKALVRNLQEVVL